MATISLVWSWVWRLGITALLITISIYYVRGWHKLRATEDEIPHVFINPISKAARNSFLAGLTLLFIALISPFAQLAGQFFSARVAQHLWLIAWSPALLWAGNPIIALSLGVPESFKMWWKRNVVITAVWRKRLHFITAPAPVWILFVSSYWVWYDPTLHQLTIDHVWVRNLEVVMLFTVACLYWWHITASFPHIHALTKLGRTLYTAVAIMPIKVVGLILLFGGNEIYAYPQNFQFSGLTINDLSMGSILLWVLGGTVYLTSTIVQARNLLVPEDEKPPLPSALWDSEEMMIAPGIKK